MIWIAQGLAFLIIIAILISPMLHIRRERRAQKRTDRALDALERSISEHPPKIHDVSAHSKLMDVPNNERITGKWTKPRSSE